MKQVYTSIILLLTMLFGAMSIAQESQKNFINYQGVARNADGTLMNGESLTIGVKLKFGASAETSYEESHSLTTDANGVFSLLIGNGSTVAGDFNDLPWGGLAPYATVSINGNEIGTTELMAVPYALSSADNQWHTLGDDIENKNGGNVFVTGSLYASKDLSLAEGTAVNEFSTDITLGQNSDEIVPTQKAIKTYVDSQLGGTGGGADDQTAAEVAYDNSTSGLTATTAQDAIDELVSDGTVDADSDPTNEIQILSFDTATSELSLTDGGSVILPSGGTDADADPNNEIQDISLSGTELTITEGSTIDLAPIIPPGGTDDQNADEVPYDNTTSGLTASDTQAAIDELASGGLVDTDDQDLVLTGDVLTIEDGSGSVDLSAYKDVDVTTKTGILLGDGSNISGLVGTADGQVAKWNAGTSEWEAGTDATGGGGSSLWTDNGGDIYYNSGKVGIGKTNPAGKLHVSDVSGLTPFLTMEATTDNPINVRYSEEGNDLIWNQYAEIGADDASSSMSFDFWDGGTDRRIMTLKGNRRIGINNSNPQSTLDVQGKIRSTLLTGAGERNVVADADGNLTIGAGGGGSSLWSENGDGIFRNSGNVGIGAIPSTQRRLYVNTTDATIRDGIYSSIAHSGYKVAISGRAEGNNDNYTFGNRSDVRGESTGEVWAYRGDVGGAGSGTKYGLDLIFYDGTGGAKYGIHSEGEDKNYFSGDVGIGTKNPTVELDVRGDIKTSGEFHRTASGNANMVPIAYGTIRANGNVGTGSGNFSVTKVGVGNYQIKIDGENYFWTSYTSQLTVNDSNPGFIKAGSVGGNLTVTTYDISGSATDNGFTFVVFKP